MPPSRTHIVPTGIERHFGEDEIIVSKTDLQGKITYANDVFIRVSGYSEEELIGAPHSLIRHPDMPRAVFKLLWDTLAAGEEIFAYVNNLAASGDNYWVFAHVTPSLGADGKVIGYHSNRRVPEPARVADGQAALCGAPCHGTPARRPTGRTRRVGRAAGGNPRTGRDPLQRVGLDVPTVRLS